MDECTGSDTGDAIWDRDRRKTGTISECATFYSCEIRRKCDACKSGAIDECRVFNLSYDIGDRHIRQSGTTRESITSDLGDGSVVWNHTVLAAEH